jgi:hypothetical protein
MNISLDQERIQKVREKFPSEGLFAEKDWLLSPEPFLIDSKTAEFLEKLGHWLWKFTKAANQLYSQSKKGKQPEWVARYLDAGKPLDLVEAQQKFTNEIPKIIRPDIILTENGYVISELDSVPGGIGLTGWLNQTYADLGFDVLGGASGMIEGFQSIFPEGVIAVSDESATYRPEMNWLVRRLTDRYGPHWNVVRAEDWDFSRPTYRFFELFDLPNLPSRSALFAATNSGTLQMTPPLKAFLEEKMWMSLLWMRPLHAFWQRQLSGRHEAKLRELMPQTWIVDPMPIPHTAVLPGLEIQSWNELKDFSQTRREYVLKVSGFSELAWGSRGVYVGPDLSHQEWGRRLDEAVNAFSSNPYILQRFGRGKLFEQRFLDSSTGEFKIMKGRVRLCPYYFIETEQIRLGGVLATIVPADKKLVHGMRDGILAPVAVSEG